MNVTDRFFPTFRQLTGTPTIRHAYVYDRETGKPVAACQHAHRSDATARRCAEWQYRRFLKLHP